MDEPSIEAAAKALAEWDGYDWDDVSDRSKEVHYRQMARVVLDAAATVEIEATAAAG